MYSRSQRSAGTVNSEVRALANLVLIVVPLLIAVVVSIVVSAVVVTLNDLRALCCSV